MDNLYFSSAITTPFDKITNLKVQSDIKYTLYEQSTNTISFITNNGIIYFLDYSPKKTIDKFTCRKQYGPIEDVIGKNVVLFTYLVQKQQALIITREGDIFTVAQSDGSVDIKAQNDDGIVGASISPLQQYVYVATKNRTLIQLDMQFDLLKQIPIDDDTENPPQQGCQNDEVYFTWRADGKFMVVNFPVKNANGEGRKCFTRDQMLTITKSPSKSDPDPKGLVQSVSEKPIKQMGAYVCWQPLGSIICSYDTFIRQDTKQVKRIIFWQKNGLRHLQFQIHNCVKDIKNIHWIQCRPHQHHQLLLIDAITTQNKRVILFYYRANYHWYLKNILDLHSKNVICVIQENMRTNLAIFRNNTIDIIQLKLSISQQNWISFETESQKNIQSIFTVIDGNKLHITDFNLNVIPPPMSQFCFKFQQNTSNGIIRATKKIINKNGETYYAVLLGNIVKILRYTDRKLKQEENFVFEFKQGNSWQDIIVTQFDIEEFSPQLIVKINKQTYKSVDKKICFALPQMKSICQETLKPYKLMISGSEQQFSGKLVDHNLTLFYNGLDILISSECTSFIFYHEFFLFTTRSAGMYEKLFIFNLQLDKWLFEGNVDLSENLQNIQKSKKLNFRSIERGGIIMACSKGRIILQLPRGNLQTFSPKIISISRVRKQIISQQYGKAFELIRTHKLDFNLIFDINSEGFLKNCENIMKQIQKVDFVNLFIAQLKNTISEELEYCFNAEQMQQISNNFQLNLQDKKIQKVCQEVSEKLREINKEKYILSIFTSDIRSGKLQSVLFEIKKMREQQGDQNQNPVNIAPHITMKNAQQKKKRSAQEILEYVCWLVDAVVIYQQSLLTYDLELASITARCTQKDPKQYIPYLQSLKKIQDSIELRKTICLNLKNYDKAIEELSKGNEDNKKQALELIQKHELFRTGLLSFKKINDETNIKKVKEIMITYLISKNQINEAYNLCCSIGAFQRALQLAIQDMDAKKIQQVYTEVEKPPEIAVIIEQIKQGVKNRSDFAALYIMIGNYEEAVRNYLKAGDYKLAYQYSRKTSKQFYQNQVLKGFELACSLMKNRLIKQKSAVIQKYNRLQVVQKQKMKTGVVAMGKPRQNDDMYSQISQSGRSGTQYTISTTTGMKKKKDKKRSILNRNVKEGSPIQQEYLIAYINDIKNRAEQNIKQAKILIQQLIYLTMLDQALSLKNEVNSYSEIMNNKSVKYVSQIKFQQQHIEAKQLYQKEQKKIAIVQSFDYLLK